MPKKTFWEALAKLPPKLRSRLRLSLAFQLKISDNAVLKHLKTHSFSGLRETYREKICTFFMCEPDDIKDNSDILFHEEWGRYIIETEMPELVSEMGMANLQLAQGLATSIINIVEKEGGEHA